MPANVVVVTSHWKPEMAFAGESWNTRPQGALPTHVKERAAEHHRTRTRRPQQAAPGAKLAGSTAHLGGEVAIVRSRTSSQRAPGASVASSRAAVVTSPGGRSHDRCARQTPLPGISTMGEA